jgi:hypothetical protein
MLDEPESEACIPTAQLLRCFRGIERKLSGTVCPGFVLGALEQTVANTFPLPFRMHRELAEMIHPIPPVPLTGRVRLRCIKSDGTDDIPALQRHEGMSFTKAAQRGDIILVSAARRSRARGR